MYTSTTIPTTGEAYIAIRKGRLKHFGNNVYLSDKQNFEIELYNPSQTTKLAKISINGKSISNSGIVLKPGQRHFIERYIDSPNKFQFETYVVEDTASTKTAIQKNGLVEVSFYDEQVPAPVYTPQYDWTLNNNDLKIKYFCDQSPQNLLNQASRRSSGIGGQSCNSMDLIGSSSNSLASYKSQNLDAPEEKYRSMTLNSMASLKETGTVEKGAYSAQKFLNYSGNFNPYVTNTVTLRILPASEKPVEMGEITIHCTECGMKRKNNWKHCPACGTKF